MTNKLELPQQQMEQTPVLVSLFSLFVGVCILSGAAILIRLSEQELGPKATIFNRLWIFVTLFLLLEPLLTAILASLIFYEWLSPLNWLAFFLVLAGIYLAKSSQGTEKST